MSHYLDSVVAGQDVRLDITDVYVFRGEVGTVFVLSVNSSAAGSDAPDGFHPHAHYDFRIDTNGDAIEDLCYRVAFGRINQQRRQPLELRRLLGADAREHAATGELLVWGTSESVLTGSEAIRLWAGLAAESFYVEPTVQFAVCQAVRYGRRVDLANWQPRRAVNVFAGTTVYAIVLEVPDGAFGGLVGPQHQIGLWGTTTLATDTGGWRPIDRMGQPMAQPLFNPPGSERACDYSTTHPVDDRANYGEVFATLVAGVLAAEGTANEPLAYGKRVANILLPDVLQYQIGSSATYGFAVRNGRYLTDNVPDVVFSLVANRAISGGLSKRHAAGAPRPRFPYVPPPPTSASDAA
jgi:hypothetical protein